MWPNITLTCPSLVRGEVNNSGVSYGRRDPSTKYLYHKMFIHSLIWHNRMLIDLHFNVLSGYITYDIIYAEANLTKKA